MAQTQTASSHDKIEIGISSCLLGEEVRFDGGHKRDSYIIGTLSEYFEFVPVCPEVAIGLGTPREPIRMVRSAWSVSRTRKRTSPTHCAITDAGWPSV